MIRIQDVIRGRNLYSVQVHQTVADVARHMADLRVGAILVLEKEELRGLFSERDLMTRIVVEQRNAETTPVSAVMTTNLATIDESATLGEALECMNGRSCRHLPVMSGTRVTGFLSMRDLMLVELNSKTEELQHLHAYLAGSA